MLPLDKLEAALESCNTEAFWKPSYAEGILCVPLVDEGTAGGVDVPTYKARHKFQGLVVSVNKTKRVEVGDLICFDMGRSEEITTQLGETFFHITERNCAGRDEEFAKPPEPTLLPSGLWVTTG